MFNDEDEFVEKVCIFESNCCVFYLNDNQKCAIAHSRN